MCASTRMMIAGLMLIVAQLCLSQHLFGEEIEIRRETPPGMVYLEGATFKMGSANGPAHESPVHDVHLDAFYMDAHEVTNTEFEQFVLETRYRTEAEQWNWSLVFSPDTRDGERVPGAKWWRRVDGATWRHPEGPDSDLQGRMNEPVVQVSWSDAQAYCKWAGKRLPTEAEWEYAARGGKVQQEFAWGESFTPENKFMANTWQGPFPGKNTGDDGHPLLAEVGQYPPNAFGLYDMAGNVWEWCADWYAPQYYNESPIENPTGPDVGEERVQRGGSWLCSSSYCTGYRVAHRNKSAPDTGLSNVGFRCVVPL